MTADTWAGCTKDGQPPIVGRKYKIISSRKGTFFGVVTHADDSTWATVKITDGVASAMMAHNVRSEGEEVTVRSSLCRMVLVP